MSRTIQQIYDSLDQERRAFTELIDLQPNPDSAQTLLSDLTTTSKVAEWRLWMWIVSVGIWIHEKLWDAFKLEVEDRIAISRYGTAAWFCDVAKRFQNGFALTWIDGQLTYADTTSPTAQAARIITRAACVDAGWYVRLKVAKGAPGSVTPLSAPELAAFQSYMAGLRPAGVNLLLQSLPADDLKLNLTVYYDPQVQNVGFLISDGTPVVQIAIDNYITNLPFNGRLTLSGLIDAIQTAPGVIQAYVDVAEYKYGALAYTPIIDFVIPDSGYFQLDSGASSITYIADV